MLPAEDEALNKTCDGSSRTGFGAGLTGTLLAESGGGGKGMLASPWAVHAGDS